jgi:membrane-associated phospholipid phosphatase
VALQAIALLVLMCLIYIAAVGWPAGRAIDDAARPDEEEGTFWRALLALPVESLRIPTFLLAGAVAIVLARRRGPLAAAAAAAMLIGPNLSARLLELVILGGLDPLGGEHERPLGVGFFPSGHATAAMSLAVAVILIAPATHLRAAGALAATYAAAVGVGLVAVDSHTPSDILGGYLLTAAWGVPMAALAPPDGDGLPPVAAPLAGAAAALALLAATTVDAPAAGAAAFALGSGVLTAVAFGLIALLQRR